jgi:hypothetical protein
MMRKPTMNLAGPAARLFLGGVALALATLALSFLRVNLAATAFVYLVVILVLSLAAWLHQLCFPLSLLPPWFTSLLRQFSTSG